MQEQPARPHLDHFLADVAFCSVVPWNGCEVLPGNRPFEDEKIIFTRQRRRQKIKQTVFQKMPSRVLRQNLSHQGPGRQGHQSP